MAAGSHHTCSLLTSGGVECWGGAGPNSNLGTYFSDGTSNPRSLPGDVVGLTSAVASIGVGDSLTCLRTVAGGVKCWGLNDYGGVGDGTMITRLSPVDVSGMSSGVTAVTVGYSFACALTDAGGVKCWGGNFNGELGDGTTASRAFPSDVTGLTANVISISAGAGHACAILFTGAVKSWGDDNPGHLGDGTLTTRFTPVDVVGLRAPVVRISAGATSTCALLNDASLKCWGDNQNGQIGDGTVGFRTTATIYFAAPSFSQPLAVADAASVTAPVDCAMIARYLAGLSGRAITSGIDTTGALRTDAAELARYFETMRPLLDIDGNGEFNPLTDGLLLIRYLLGQRDDALIAAAVGSDVTRAAATAIQAYLAALLP